MGHTKKNTINPKLTVKERLSLKKKDRKHKLKEKRARLVVKNLPFKATEETLKEHFEKYGKVANVELLKKADGKLVGCGFIQFEQVQKAAKAKHYTNCKSFLGREIKVDFAKPKNKYTETKIKVEDKDVKVEVKEEPKDEDDSATANDKIVIENEELDSEVESVESEKEDEGDESGSEESENSEDDDSADELEMAIDKGEEKVHKPFVSNDVEEGRTIFIKNVPFDATNEDLRSCMSQFGPLYYALVCIDKFTEHSKGTAFVKFVNKEDSEKALNAGTELTLLGNVLDCHLALKKEEIKAKSNEKQNKQEPKDSRNLYLVKEGVILAGTKAAEGVSASDMAKRLQIEQYKTQMLRNLNMFISRERLVIHNLPLTWDDKKLRTLVEKYGGKDPYVKEARVMRDLKNVDAKGVGQTKGFGFVTFSRHENALHCLRTLNNNPNIFAPGKRPIVTFSIENKKMIKAKQQRLEKSKLKNPLSKNYDSTVVEKEKESRKRKLDSNVSDDVQAFSGVTAKPGVTKMRSRYNLKTQAKLHYQNMKNAKRQKKLAKKSLKERQSEFTKQPKQKINKKQESDQFTKIENQYKKKLASIPSKSKKGKWYAQ